MSYRIWLPLGLALAWLHVVMMQSLAVHLSMDAHADQETPLVFSTRSIVLPSPPPTPAAPAKSKTKPVAPAPQAQGESVQAVLPLEAAAQAVNAPVLPEPALAAPQSAASAPDPAPVQAVAEPTPAPTDTAQEAATANTTPTFNADGLPSSIKLMYQVDANKFPFRLQSELLWQQDNQQYQSSLSVSAFGQSRIQNSRGRIGRLGLLPERFSDKFRSEVAAHFDYESARVTFSANTPDVVLQAGAQDRLSVLIQLAALVASQPQRFEPGSQFSIQTVGPRDAAVWIFSFGAQENLDLPGGNRPSIKVVRLPRQPYDQKLEVWLAPSLSYLPARIRITESNGDFIDQLYKDSEAIQVP